MSASQANHKLTVEILKSFELSKIFVVLQNSNHLIEDLSILILKSLYGKDVVYTPNSR